MAATTKPARAKKEENVAPPEPTADKAQPAQTLPTPEPEMDVKALTAALAGPFEAAEVKWKPQMVKGNRALAIAYVDVRVIQDRLDDVLGVEGWQDEYQLLPDNSVMCRLRLKLGKRWITKMDVGSPSEQPDGGDRLKAAFSDALKRAAVKFGIGRYLYRLPSQWVDYDAQRKQFAQTPQLPSFALPSAVKPPRPATIQPSTPGERRDVSPPVPARPDKPAPTVPMPVPAPSKPRPAAKAGASSLPADGAELHRRLRDYDARLAEQGVSNLGALLAFVTQAGVKAGFGADMTQWPAEAIRMAVDATREFEGQLRQPQPSEQKPAA